MSSARLVSCLLCGQMTPMRSITASVELNCPDCGPYEVTVGAISHLRVDAQTKAIVRAEVRRQLDSGVERPQINLDILKALKAR
jgi:hypothetical protein